MEFLSREQVRRIDKLATEEYGIPGVVLMENAGRSVAEELLKFAALTGVIRESGGRMQTEALNAAIFCGGGNNGGDGYVTARHLHNAGAKVTLYLANDPAKLSGDAAIHSNIADKMSIERWSVLDEDDFNEAMSDLEKSNVVVDALLGTGFSGELRANMAAVIRRINALRVNNRKVIAVDLPSGLDCDSGKPANVTVRADLTVTLVAEKKGFAKESAKPFLGRVVVGGIGVPLELIERTSI